jgi:hypothetical protein
MSGANIWERFEHDPRREENGMLTPAEPDERSDQVVEANRRHRQQALFNFLGQSLVCWIIWAAVMFGEFPWPAFVMLGTGMNYLRLATNREDSIQRVQREMEKKERRKLEARRKQDD